MCGQRVKDLRCVALTDNEGLFSNIHHLTANMEDFRLQSDILELRQSIEQEKTVQEVRYVHPSLNIADALTKATKTGIMLLQLVQTVQYDLPGGTTVGNSTTSSAKTWPELMQVEQQEGRSREEEDMNRQLLYQTQLQKFLGKGGKHCFGDRGLDRSVV